MRLTRLISNEQQIAGPEHYASKILEQAAAASLGHYWLTGRVSCLKQEGYCRLATYPLEHFKHTASTLHCLGLCCVLWAVYRRRSKISQQIERRLQCCDDSGVEQEEQRSSHAAPTQSVSHDMPLREKSAGQTGALASFVSVLCQQTLLTSVHSA